MACVVETVQKHAPINRYVPSLLPILIDNRCDWAIIVVVITNFQKLAQTHSKLFDKAKCAQTKSMTRFTEKTTAHSSAQITHHFKSNKSKNAQR